MIGLDEVGKALGGLFDLVREVVPDKDKQAELQLRLAEVQARVTDALITATTRNAELEAQVRTAELNIKTYPWVDAVHKMGRQLHAAAIIVAVVVFQTLGKPISADVLMVMAAPGTLYTYIKGKGQ